MKSQCMKLLLVPLFIIALCVFLWIQLGDLPEPRFEPMGAAMFPKMVLAAIIFLTGLDMAINLLQARRKPSGSAAPSSAPSAQEKPEAPSPLDQPAPSGKPEKNEGWKSFILPVVACLGFSAYILLLSYTEIPYVLLTFAFIFLECSYFGHFKKRAVLLSALTSAFVTGFIYVVFGVFMKTVFP